MKKLCLFLCLLFGMMSAANARILPAAGVDEGFKAWTGHECMPAVVLCQSLSILDERGDQGGRKVGELSGGNTVPVFESWDGYAKISYLDGAKTGWVRNEYLMLDPAWYICDEDLQVYAYPHDMAPRVAWLEAETRLPILAEYDDGVRGWVCVSLRGAAGWVPKRPQDTVTETWFRPAMLEGLTRARLAFGETEREITASAQLGELAQLLTFVRDEGGMMAGCPFTASLKVWLADGREIDMQLATDSCCVYRVDGRDYTYARHFLGEEEGSPDNTVLFSLFGVDIQNLWAQ